MESEARKRTLLVNTVTVQNLDVFDRTFILVDSSAEYSTFSWPMLAIGARAAAERARGRSFCLAASGSL